MRLPALLRARGASSSVSWSFLLSRMTVTLSVIQSPISSREHVRVLRAVELAMRAYSVSHRFFARREGALVRGSRAAVSRP